MTDFNDFLEKVLEPIQLQEQTGQTAAPSAPTETAQTPQPATDEELERRYVAVMNALFADAVQRGAGNVFADVVAWKLAVLAYQYGPRATGDVVRRFGVHLEAIAEAVQAQREADEAKEAGHPPN